jgi:hypothetical protein
MDEGVDLAFRLLGSHATRPHRAAECLDRHEEDRHGDQSYRREIQIQAGHHDRHEQESADGAHDDQQPILEQNLKGAGIRPGPEDDVPDRGAVVAAQ